LLAYLFLPCYEENLAIPVLKEGTMDTIVRRPAGMFGAVGGLKA